MSFQRLASLKPYQTETTPCPIKMSSNENPFELSESLKQRIIKNIAKVPFGRYPDPTSKRLKSIIAKRFDIQPDQIVLGNGSDELIQLLTIIAGKADQSVMFPVPTFPMYQVASDIVGRPKLEIPLNENFDIDLSTISIEKLQQVGLAFFARPNNPTGNSFSLEMIQHVADQGIFTVIDEAYIDFANHDDCLSLVSESDHIVVLRTLSKIGLAGIRLGILIARSDIAQMIDAARMPFNITYPSQVIAETVLTDGVHEIENQIQTIKSERQRLYKALNAYPEVSVIPSDANFLFVKIENGNQVHQNLIEHGILVRNMSKYASLNNYLRISVGTPQENTLFLEKFEKIYANLSHFMLTAR
ncbi:histidinol-phosphate aminotransferase [Candidatus Magnetomorum sp. HK-1]|nr:histidinol-phosphate aminotransferase [Candidatus Magnetomorum sp. HK-1]